MPGEDSASREDSAHDEAEGREYPDDLRGLARELVRIPSENPPGKERVVSEYVRDWARAHDLAAELVDTPGHPDRPNAVVTAGTVGTGGDAANGEGDTDDAPTVVLNGHTDVVPAGDPGAWSREPYAADVVDPGDGPVLYGRGSADMKTGLAVSLLAADALADRFAAGDLQGGVVVHAAAGEETGVPGTRACIDAGYGGDCAVVLEPTGLRVATSAKGVVTYRVTVHGESTHASNPDEGRNAVDLARSLFDRIDDYDADLREREDALVGRGYASVTAVEAGTDGNMGVVPGTAEFLLDRRVLPDESVDDVDAEVAALLAAAERQDGVATDVETVQHYRSASVDPGHPLATVVRDATGDRAPDDPWGLPAATDAREFVADGTPAVVWGPGSLSQAHTVDEHVPLDEAAAALDVLQTAVARLLDREGHG